MTQLLEKAFTEAAKLPEQEQDTVATWLLDELASEKHWNTQFTATADVLTVLAEEALAEHRAGKTRPLDPERL